ncbi:hypothetical protein KKIDH5335_48340 (plasmid) [Vibrio fluvialis]|nr:hypothetical protein KKIDH5335_48340 [Vibrio fluvialis]
MKGYMKPILIAAGLGLTLVGCKSTPKPVELIPFSNEHSYAYNVANQTVLTKNDSKLRDFTIEEVDAINVPTQHKGGDTSVLFGSLKLLTLDLTGVIDIAGGAAANLSADHHTAGKARWLIKIDKSKFSNQRDAALYAKESIIKAYEEVYKKSLSTKLTVEEVKGGTLYNYVAVMNSGEEVSLQNAVWDMPNGDKFDFIAEDGSYYYIGYSNDNKNYSSFRMVSNPIVYNYKNEQNQVDITAFYMDVTSNLPESFILYTPSFEKIYTKEITLTDLTQRVPAIYQSGKKYEFIKPE